MLIVRIALLAFLTAILIRGLFELGVPSVGGKRGRRKKIAGTASIPDGLAAVSSCAVRVAIATQDADRYATEKDFLRQATREVPKQMRIYRVAGASTEIEIPVEPPDYERLDVADLLALLRELPDLRSVRRLHVSDEPCFLDPWKRKITGQDVRLLGHATNFSLIALYRPDRRFRRDVGLTLLHEWLHLVAYRHQFDLWRFKRAGIVEPLAPAPFEAAGVRTWELPHEGWADLGEKLLGYDEALARQTASALPLHTTILWWRIAKIMRRTPKPLCSTRYAEFEALGDFVRAVIVPLAKRRD